MHIICMYMCNVGGWNPRALHYTGALHWVTSPAIIKNVTINISHFTFSETFMSSGNPYHLSIVIDITFLRFLFFVFLLLLISYYLPDVRSFTYIIWCPKNKKLFWLLVSSGGCRCRCVAGMSSRTTFSILFYTHVFCSPTKRSPHRMNGYPCRLWVPKITQELVAMLGSSLKMETPIFLCCVPASWTKAQNRCLWISCVYMYE